jgi:hypothetical protein
MTLVSVLLLLYFAIQRTCTLPTTIVQQFIKLFY